jgi:hypothetical protein
VSTFSADDISGPVHMEGTAKYYFAVALPGGGEGHAVVGVDDAGVQTDEHERRGRVAAALNSQVQASGDDAVVDALKSGDGLPLSLTGF